MSNLNELDVSTPLNGESVAIMAAEIRNLKTILKNVILAAHKNDGSLKPFENNTIEVTNITAGSVTTEKLADGSVNEDKLIDDSVSTPKLANESVTTEKLANQSVTIDKIALNAVGTNQLKSHPSENTERGVETDNIKDLAVNNAKISDVALEKLTGGANDQFLFKVAGAWAAVSAGGALVYNVLTNQFDLGSLIQVATFGDVKTSGASGGTTTANTWVTRTLGEISDPDNIMTFSGNSFKLKTGNYLFYAIVPASHVDRNQACLFLNPNTALTDNRIALYGSSEYTSIATVNGHSMICGLLTVLDEDDVYSIKHYCSISSTVNDLGHPASSIIDPLLPVGAPAPVEIYTQGFLAKLS
tara:strand:- start:23397 stop:24470 length:1074 start_codon:yes stop_codon:yes gene_type:complete